MMINSEMLEQLNTTEEQLIKHLDEDVREIFSSMVGVVIPQSQITDTTTQFKEYITGMIGFAGSYNGMISVNTPNKIAIKIASQMLGMEVTEVDSDVQDALGEIANMIGGSFKHHFVSGGHEVRLSTPSTISGNEYVITVSSAPDSLTLLFTFEDDQFMVNLYLENGN